MLFDFVLLDKLRAARHIAVFSGAGMSAESGIPTFREAHTGLWARYRPEDLATPDAFLRDPATVWNWYAWRRELLQQAQPNPGHLAVARLEGLVPKVTVITQNVDGLHQQAGSSEVIELHGNILKTRCFDCGQPAGAAASAPSAPSTTFAASASIEEEDEVPPRCGRCGGMLRPGVVWFGESLPSDAWRRAAEVLDDADVFFCIGTSSLVEPAASLPRHARSCGRTVIQINPEATSHDEIAQYILRGKAGEVMPDLLAAAWPNA